MFPAHFDYHRADSVEEALRLLGEQDDAKLLAGGHSLVPMLKLRLAQPATLVDIGRLPGLAGVGEEGGRPWIGALTTHHQVATSELLQAKAPLLAEAAAKIGDPAVRNKGTLGGNIAHADPASDLPAALVALDASVHLASSEGRREVAARDFFVDLLETALGERELILGVSLPAAGAGRGSCYLKVEHPASGYAVCGAAAVVELDSSGRASQVELAFNGIANTPHRAGEVAQALVGTDLSDGAIARAVDDHLRVEEPLGDVHASGEYRVQLARVYGRRALAVARDRAG